MTTCEGRHGGKQKSDKGTTKGANRRERSDSLGRLQRVLAPFFLSFSFGSLCFIIFFFFLFLLSERTWRAHDLSKAKAVRIPDNYETPRCHPEMLLSNFRARLGWDNTCVFSRLNGISAFYYTEFCYAAHQLELSLTISLRPITQIFYLYGAAIVRSPASTKRT